MVVSKNVRRRQRSKFQMLVAASMLISSAYA